MLILGWLSVVGRGKSKHGGFYRGRCMPSINGVFADQNPLVLSVQLITARTAVKTDLNVILVESDQIRTTNTFLITQNIGSGGTSSGGTSSAVAQTAQGTIGQAQTGGGIGPSGQPRGGGELEL